MGWKSAHDSIQYWGCSRAEFAYFDCVLDTYYEPEEAPNELRIRLRGWDNVFTSGPAMYIKFKYDRYYIRLWQND